MDQRILDKIKKCLALAQSPEPHEAAAAMRQAQKLMDIHGVTHTHLAAADIGEVQVSSVVSVSVVNKWELSLMHMVAQAFGCKIMWTRSRSDYDDVFGKFTFVGLKQQLELASYTAQVLQRRLVKARSAYQQTLTITDRKARTIKADSFALGWVAAVSKTVHNFANPAGVDTLIDDHVKLICNGGKAKTRARNVDGFALASGREAGAGESLHRPMGATKDATLRLGV